MGDVIITTSWNCTEISVTFIIPTCLDDFAVCELWGFFFIFYAPELSDDAKFYRYLLIYHNKVV